MVKQLNLPFLLINEIFFGKRVCGGRKVLCITIVHKVYNYDFLFVGLTTLGTFIEFWLVGLLSWVFERFNHYLLSTEGVILCINIWDVHQLSYPFRSLVFVDFFACQKNWFLSKNCIFSLSTHILTFKISYRKKGYFSSS